MGGMPAAQSAMTVRLWGVRGSFPVPGTETARYGGNTSCIEVTAPGVPTVVFDCGTGARKLGPTLFAREEREVHVVFTHFHMDHLFGFPFFAPIFAPSFEITVTAPAFSPDGTKDRIARFLNGIFHPIRMSEVPAKVQFAAVRPGNSFNCGPWLLRAAQLNHPGGSCAYRIERNGRSTVYVTDTAPLSRPGEGLAGGQDPFGREQQLVELCRGADLVIFDTMFSFNEYLEKMTWGHSYPEYAYDLCKAAGAKKLLLFHHAPDASDADLDTLAAHWGQAVDPIVEVAREGMEVVFEARVEADT